VAIGQFSFGESSLYPSSLNSPGGGYGLGAAAPMMGSRWRKLKKGDLVFVDTAVGADGYHTDKTVTYVFGAPPPPPALEAHQRCLEIYDTIAAQLRPGAVPSEIYAAIIRSLPPEFLENFMGFGRRRVKFLGHGIGLVVDEWPVISEGFDEPLQEGVTLAVEPKKGIPNFGLVGIENTLVVTPGGGRNLTGPGRGLARVG
jgi:Xaa-Pro aminopeptidase